MADVIGYTTGLLFAVNVTGVLFCVGVELYSRYNENGMTDKFNEL